MHIIPCFPTFLADWLLALGASHTRLIAFLLLVFTTQLTVLVSVTHSAKMTVLLDCHPVVHAYIYVVSCLLNFIMWLLSYPAAEDLAGKPGGGD